MTVFILDIGAGRMAGPFFMREWQEYLLFSISFRIL